VVIGDDDAAEKILLLCTVPDPCNTNLHGTSHSKNSLFSVQYSSKEKSDVDFCPNVFFEEKKKEFVIPFLQLWRDCRVLVDFGMWNRTTAMVNALYLSFPSYFLLLFRFSFVT
jgi:hypothetical protein